MITVEDAENLVFQHITEYPAVEVPLAAAAGRILREDIFADRDSPPFNRVTMDGIAIGFEAWKQGVSSFQSAGIQRAGEPQCKLNGQNNCLEVMTGAVLPEGTDCVIRVEDLTFKDGKAFLKEGLELTYMQNVHLRASDHAKGIKLIGHGIRLLSPHIGVAASEGKYMLKVAPFPSAAIISTGDELREIEAESLEPYQIRMSNSYAMQAVLKLKGFEKADIFHLKDDKELLYRELKKIIADYQIVILSGGVSMGRFDYIPAVLAELGVDRIFHKVSQRPGKPFWFGKKAEEAGTLHTAVFGLPGNPVSTLICFHRYVIPALERAMGLQEKKKYAVLAEDFKFNKSLTYFLPVKIEYGNGTLSAWPVKNNGSGDYASLTGSDGFIELAKETDFFARGYEAPFYKWE